MLTSKDNLGQKLKYLFKIIYKSNKIFVMKFLKKIISIITILIFISCNLDNKNNKDENYSLSSVINNLEDSTLVVLKTFSNNSKKIDSALVVNGRFNLKFFNQNEGLYLITIKDSKPYSFDFWYDKKNLQLDGDYNKKESIKIKNSPTNDFLRKYRNIPQKYNSQIENALKNVTDPEKSDEIFQKFVDSIEMDQINMLFTNPNNLFSLNEIVRLNTKISKNRLNSFYNSLNNEMKKKPDVKILESYINSNQISIGEKFIDFEAIDLNRKKTKLSDYEGKIILLDFWAYWCTWCHVQNEKEFSYLNEKYNKDLVIISYSLDEEYDIWKNSTKKDSYKWTNLSNLMGMKDPVAFMYKVKNLPHSFLINQKGIVLKEFIGYKKDSIIEKELKKLIYKNN